MKHFESPEVRELKEIEERMGQMLNCLADYIRMTTEHLKPLYDAVDKATALIEAQIADKPSCENCLYHDTEAGTDICKYWDEVPPAASAEDAARQGKADQAQGKAADRRRNGTHDGISDEGGTEQ